MRFVQVGPVHPFRGGIAHFAGCLHKQLVKSGHESFLVTFKNQYPSLLFPGKNQTEENEYFNDLNPKRVLTPYNPLTFQKTLHQIIKRRPDYVIFHFFLPYFVPAYSFLLKQLRKRKIKTIIVTHNIDFHEKWPFAEHLTRHLLINADYILTLSNSVFVDAVKSISHCRRQKKSNLIQEDSKSDCSQICFQLGERIVKVIASYHPLYEFHNANKFTRTEAKERLGLNDRKVILFFGYIKPYKGVDLLIRSFEYIKREIPNAILLLVGEIYGDADTYTKLIDSCKYREDIILKNEYVDGDEVELYFKAADVLALPYTQATQSGVIQVSYVMGVGAVVTPVGGLPEMVEDKKTGIVCQAVSEESLAQGIIDFFHLDPALVQSEIERYKANFSWERFVDILIESL